MMSPSLPEVKVNVGLTPDQDGSDAITYGKLRGEIDRQAEYLDGRWDLVFNLPEGDIEESLQARRLAETYLLQTAIRGLQSWDNPEKERLWQERFTQASIELYGQPDEKIVRGLAANERNLLSEFFNDPRVDQDILRKVIDVYDYVAGHSEGEAIPELSHEAFEAVDAFLSSETNSKVLEMTDSLEDRPYAPKELVGIFREAINILKSNDSNWDVWKVELVDQSGLSIDPEKKIVRIGERRSSAYPAEVKKLLGHELLIHALRATNALRQSDELLRETLPEYGVLEEGLGIVAEVVISGERSEKAINRYVDIALALGSNNYLLSRKELFEFAYNRQILANQIKGKPVDHKAIEKETWTHIDRIFRGGDGDEDSKAVYTMYSYYYSGYLKAVNYLNEALASGVSADKLIEYIMQAKFDPTNPTHKKHIRENGLVPSL
jgi:hypothetical protein